MLHGKWTYRSFRNEPALVGGDAAAALALIEDEGVLDLDPTGPGSFGGGLGMASGQGLTLTGRMPRAEDYEMTGVGIEGTPTEGRHYEFRFARGHAWPTAADQPAILTGSVIRLDIPGPAAAFIAVEQREPLDQPGRIYRHNVLTAGL